MVMLSDLLRYKLIDEHGASARLSDVSYPATAEDYPAVTEILFENGELRSMPWSSVKKLDVSARTITVQSLKRSEEDQISDGDADILMRRDVMDALIIDLAGRTTTRATDIQFELDGMDLRIKAVDAGIGAMLRRISRGRYSRINKKSLYDWKYVEFLRGDPDAAESGAGYRMRIGHLPAGEIAQLSDYIPYLHAAELLSLLPDDKAADVLEAMDVERQVQVIEEFETDEAVELIRRMSPDLATDLLARVGIGMMKRYLDRLPKEQSERITELLRYPENSVGGVMINDMVCFSAEDSIADVRENLSELLKDRDFVELAFVVNNTTEKKLLGSLSLRELLTGQNDGTVGSVMNPYLQALDPFDLARDASYRIIGAQLAAMPVINPNGKLVGAMTIDAAISQVVAASSEMRTLRIFS